MHAPVALLADRVAAVACPAILHSSEGERRRRCALRRAQRHALCHRHPHQVRRRVMRERVLARAREVRCAPPKGIAVAEATDVRRGEGGIGARRDARCRVASVERDGTKADARAHRRRARARSAPLHYGLQTVHAWRAVVLGPPELNVGNARAELSSRGDRPRRSRSTAAVSRQDHRRAVSQRYDDAHRHRAGAFAFSPITRQRQRGGCAVTSARRRAQRRELDDLDGRVDAELRWTLC